MKARGRATLSSESNASKRPPLPVEKPPHCRRRRGPDPPSLRPLRPRSGRGARDDPLEGRVAPGRHARRQGVRRLRRRAGARLRRRLGPVDGRPHADRARATRSWSGPARRRCRWTAASCRSRRPRGSSAARSTPPPTSSRRSSFRSPAPPAPTTPAKRVWTLTRRRARRPLSIEVAVVHVAPTTQVVLRLSAAAKTATALSEKGFQVRFSDTKIDPPFPEQEVRRPARRRRPVLRATRRRSSSASRNLTARAYPLTVAGPARHRGRPQGRPRPRPRRSSRPRRAAGRSALTIVVDPGPRRHRDRRDRAGRPPGEGGDARDRQERSPRRCRRSSPAAPC